MFTQRDKAEKMNNVDLKDRKLGSQIKWSAAFKWGLTAREHNVPFQIDSIIP